MGQRRRLNKITTYEIIKKTNQSKVRVWKDGKALMEGQASFLSATKDDELKALKVISLSIDQGTLVIGVK